MRAREGSAEEAALELASGCMCDSFIGGSGEERPFRPAEQWLGALSIQTGSAVGWLSV